MIPVIRRYRTAFLLILAVSFHFSTVATRAGAADSDGTIRRELWDFNRSHIYWGEASDPAKEKAAKRMNGVKGWVEYDVDVTTTGWYALWLIGMPSSWGRDIYVDGKCILRHSISMPEDRDESTKGQPRFKEANLFLEAGKHTIKFSRLDYPSQFPSSWELVPGQDRPECSLRIESMNDPIVPPHQPFEFKILGGGANKPLKYDLFLKSLTSDDAPVAVGSVEFPASPIPTVKPVTVQTKVDSGAFVLLAQRDGKWLAPNDLKSGPLIVSKVAVDRRDREPVVTSLELAGMFADGMVLQRDVPLPIWGWALPGSDVSVNFAGQSAYAKADARGCWSVSLKPLSAGGPYKLIVENAGKSAQINDVLVGDVWLLGGQSNMGGQLANAPGGQQAADEAHYPTVRFTVAMTNDANPTDPRRITCAWQTAAPGPGEGRDAMLRWNAIAYVFGTDLQKKLNVPIGMIMNSRGGTSITTWASRESQKDPAFSYWMERWNGDGDPTYAHARVAATVVNSIKTAREKQAKDPAAKTTPINVDEIVSARMIDQSRSEPGGHHRALVEPLAPFPFKGAVWYQGEADTGLAYSYGAMLKAFITDWRQTLRAPELPFVVVQVAQGSGAPFDGPPAPSRYGEMQEAQASILSTSRTSTISTYDLPGPKDDVHYKDKLPVGHRAARAALRNVYGQSDVVASGPRYQSMSVEGGKVRLSFSDIGGGLVVKGEKLGGFSIAGADQTFQWADAVIDGDQVVVSSDKVPNPVAVRYGWANRPCGANLYNKADLPAPIFRTDKWPTMTEE